MMSTTDLSTAKDGDIIKKGNDVGMDLLIYDGVPIFILPPELLKGLSQLDELKRIKDIDVREDDVFVLAYPKCGTHWLWEIIEMLKSGNTEHQKKPKETRMLEAALKRGIDAVPSPRTLNSHLPLRMLPRQMTEKKVKCIQIMRNPKDVCVSFFNHVSKMRGGFEGNFEQYMEAFLTGKLPFGSYHDYIWTWKNELADRPGLPVLTMFYEDMKDDPIRSVREVDDFLGIKASDKFYSDVAEACSFKNMKQADTQKEELVGDPWKDEASATFYRKGEKGDWKNWFTVAKNEWFDRIWNDMTKDLDIKFTYS